MKLSIKQLHEIVLKNTHDAPKRKLQPTEEARKPISHLSHGCFPFFPEGIGTVQFVIEWKIFYLSCEVQPPTSPLFIIIGEERVQYNAVPLVQILW